MSEYYDLKREFDKNYIIYKNDPDNEGARLFFYRLVSLWASIFLFDFKKKRGPELLPTEEKDLIANLCYLFVFYVLLNKNYKDFNHAKNHLYLIFRNSYMKEIRRKKRIFYIGTDLEENQLLIPPGYDYNDENDDFLNDLEVIREYINIVIKKLPRKSKKIMLILFNFAQRGIEERLEPIYFSFTKEQKYDAVSLFNYRLVGLLKKALSKGKINEVDAIFVRRKIKDLENKLKNLEKFKKKHHL